MADLDCLLGPAQGSDLVGRGFSVGGTTGFFGWALHKGLICTRMCGGVEESFNLGGSCKGLILGPWKEPVKSSKHSDPAHQKSF